MALQQHLEHVIPSSVKRGCRVMRLDQTTLTLAADNGAIAAKLRQMSAELTTLLQERGCEVTGIQIQVQVNAPPYTPPAKAHLLSTQGKSHITEFTKHLADSPLKEALDRLARRS